MSKPNLYSMTEAGEVFGVDRRTISELVRMLGITTVPVRYHKRARGITEADMETIRKALTPAPAQTA